VALSFAVAMSNVTPPAPAGESRLTVKVKVVVPDWPSACVTSVIESVGCVEATPCGVTERSSIARP
jgi:hypothetical protein